MEKKNTVLLTVIAVATLLVAVVGATFAYFTATNGTTGYATGTTNVKTAESVAGVTLNFGKVNPSSNVVYPGTMNYIGATVAAELEAGKTGTYNSTYTLNGSVTLSEAFAFEVNYSLYETSTPLAEGQTPVTCDPVANKGTATEIKYSQSCTVNAGLGTKIDSASGTIAAGDTTAAIAFSGNVNTGSTKYYYLVVEYPEKDVDQNADAGNKTITLAIDSVVPVGSTPVNQ